MDVMLGTEVAERRLLFFADRCSSLPSIVVLNCQINWRRNYPSSRLFFTIIERPPAVTLAVGLMSAAEMNWVESTEAPARDADFETCWNFIAAGVKRIVVAHNNHFRSISDQYYGLLYNTINNCCTSPPIMEGDGATAQDEEPKRPALLLYERLQYRFSDYCRPIAEELDSLPDDQLFQVYALRWGRYTATATHLDRLFSCFNGNWTRHQHIAKRDSVFTIGMLARVTWKQHVYQHLVERGRDSLIYKALINQIEQYRKGQDVDTVMLEQAIDSHAYFGLIRPRVLGLAPHSPYLVSSGPTVAT